VRTAARTPSAGMPRPGTRRVSAGSAGVILT
jgi:hypothetical protein